MELVLLGKFNKVIADELNISMRTVEVHRATFEQTRRRVIAELVAHQLAGEIGIGRIGIEQAVDARQEETGHRAHPAQRLAIGQTRRQPGLGLPRRWPSASTTMTSPWRWARTRGGVPLSSVRLVKPTRRPACLGSEIPSSSAAVRTMSPETDPRHGTGVAAGDAVEIVTFVGGG